MLMHDVSFDAQQHPSWMQVMYGDSRPMSGRVLAMSGRCHEQVQRLDAMQRIHRGELCTQVSRGIGVVGVCCLYGGAGLVGFEGEFGRQTGLDEH